MKKPNILLIISDEHRADISSFEHDSIIRMPNLDALASYGTYKRMPRIDT